MGDNRKKYSDSDIHDDSMTTVKKLDPDEKRKNKDETNRDNISLDLSDKSLYNIDNKREDDSWLDMKDVCKGLRLDYTEMQKFIDQYNDKKLNRAILNVFDDMKGLDKTDHKKLDEYANLCALSVYKRLKTMKKRCETYQKLSDSFNVKTITYRKPKVQRPIFQSPIDLTTDLTVDLTADLTVDLTADLTVDLTTDLTTELKKKKTTNDIAVDVNSILAKINTPNQRMTRDLDMQMTSLLGYILTPYGKKMELIKYKLLYYKPKKQIRVRKSNLPTVAIEIKAELDGITDILSPYVEDTKWKINIERNLNFKVPESKLVFSNTVNSDDIESEYLDTYLNMIIRYLERITDSNSVKFYIVEDNKYNIHWVLIAMSIKKDKNLPK